MGSPGGEVSLPIINEVACNYVYPNWTRGYSMKKVQENNESEIMQTVLDEAQSSYAREIVVELSSDKTEDLESNIERIVQWIQSWLKDRESNDNT